MNEKINQLISATNIKKAKTQNYIAIIGQLSAFLIVVLPVIGFFFIMNDENAIKHFMSLVQSYYMNVTIIFLSNIEKIMAFFFGMLSDKNKVDEQIKALEEQGYKIEKLNN